MQACCEHLTCPVRGWQPPPSAPSAGVQPRKLLGLFPGACSCPASSASPARRLTRGREGQRGSPGLKALAKTSSLGPWKEGLQCRCQTSSKNNERGDAVFPDGEAGGAGRLRVLARSGRAPGRALHEAGITLPSPPQGPWASLRSWFLLLSRVKVGHCH